jgi:hypothetical protein
MGEIIHEILLYLVQKPLPVQIINAASEQDQHQEKNDTGDDPEIHLRQNVFVPVRKIKCEMVVRLSGWRHGDLSAFCGRGRRQVSDKIISFMPGIIETSIAVGKDILSFQFALQIKTGAVCIHPRTVQADKERLFIWVGNELVQIIGNNRGLLDIFVKAAHGLGNRMVEFLLFVIVNHSEPDQLKDNDRCYDKGADKNSEADGSGTESHEKQIRATDEYSKVAPGF